MTPHGYFTVNATQICQSQHFYLVESYSLDNNSELHMRNIHKKRKKDLQTHFDPLSKVIGEIFHFNTMVSQHSLVEETHKIADWPSS